METTKLQSALIELGIESLSFTVAKKPHNVAVADICDAGLLAVLAYGASRKVNDTVNSARKSEGDAFDEASTITDTLERIKKGTIGTRQGVDELTKELRLIVSAKLKTLGWKSEPIRKAVKDPAVGFRAFLTEYIAKAKAMEVSQVSLETVDIVFANNWPNLVAKAEATIKARGLELEIDVK